MTCHHSISLSGWDLKTSRRVRMKILPAEPGTGIVFNGRLRAVVAYARVSGNCTCLSMDRERIRMVEHFLAASYALGVSALNVQLDAGTLPFGDGSARPFVRALIKGGFRNTAGPEPLRLKEPIVVSQGKRILIALPAPKLRINCLFSHSVLGNQFFSAVITRKNFIEQIAPARTFGRLNDVGQSFRSGCKAKALPYRGGVLGFRVKRVDGWVFPARWRFRNEACRHKVLDLLGDLALLSRPLQAEIIAFNPGHQLNLRLVSLINERYMQG
jgi:UDP-3-O-[3-hydroxymyristoyl] N-acetylglucosamine deacetylase